MKHAEEFIDLIKERDKHCNNYPVNKGKRIRSSNFIVKMHEIETYIKELYY